MHRRESVHLNYSLLPESLSNVGRELGSLTRSWESRWPTFKFTDTIRYAIFPNRLTIIDENYDFILLLFFFFSFLLLFSLFFFFDRFLIEGVLFFSFFLEIGFHIINRRCSMRFVSILFFLFLFEINNFLRRSWMYWICCEYCVSPLPNVIITYEESIRIRNRYLFRDLFDLFIYYSREIFPFIFRIS